MLFRNLFLSSLFLLTAGTVSAQGEQGVTKYVNPFIGTGADGKHFSWGMRAFWFGAA